MELVDISRAVGDSVSMQRTHEKHLSGFGENPDAGSVKNFSEILTGAIQGASDLEQSSSALAQTFLTDPDSVDIHDVTIAMAEANMAVQITKQVLDGAIKAYKEIINVR